MLAGAVSRALLLRFIGGMICLHRPLEVLANRTLELLLLRSPFLWNVCIPLRLALLLLRLLVFDANVSGEVQGHRGDGPSWGR